MRNNQRNKIYSDHHHYLPIRTFDENTFKQALRHMHRINASDVFIRPNTPIEYRKDGVIIQGTKRQIRDSEIKLVSEYVKSSSFLNKVASGEPQGFSYRIKGDADFPELRFRFHVASTNSRNSYEYSIRLIPNEPPKPEDLLLDNEIVNCHLKDKYGIRFICGGTGQGKSTTLASLIRASMEDISTSYRILTAEDPIEYVYHSIMSGSPVSQAEVPSDYKTFESAIKEYMRKSPDLALIGEIRDMDSMDATIQLSSTGHGVLTTLHLDQVHTLFERVASFYPPELQKGAISKLIYQTKLVAVQQLVPGVCGGRVAVREYLIFNAKVREDLISCPTSKKTDLLKELVLSQGTSLSQSANALYEEGKISNDVLNQVEAIAA